LYGVSVSNKFRQRNLTQRLCSAKCTGKSCVLRRLTIALVRDRSPRSSDAASSRPSDRRQRRPDGQVYFAGAAVQSRDVDWRSEDAQLIVHRCLFCRYCRTTITARLCRTHSGLSSQCSSSCGRRRRRG